MDALKRWVVFAVLSFGALIGLATSTASLLVLGPRSLLDEWSGAGQAGSVEQVRAVEGVFSLARRIAPYDRSIGLEAARATVWRSTVEPEHRSELLSAASRDLEMLREFAPMSSEAWLDIAVIEFQRQNNAAAMAAVRWVQVFAGREILVRERVVRVMFATWSLWSEAEREQCLRIVQDALRGRGEGPRRMIDNALITSRLDLIVPYLRGNDELTRYVFAKLAESSRQLQ